MSTVRRFYDKLIQLPLEEKAPTLYTCFLITKTTLERVGKPCHVRETKNGFILQDVIDAVQQKPHMLNDFCNTLQDLHIAAELAQLIKGTICTSSFDVNLLYVVACYVYCTKK